MDWHMQQVSEKGDDDNGRLQSLDMEFTWGKEGVYLWAVYEDAHYGFTAAHGRTMEQLVKSCVGGAQALLTMETNNPGLVPHIILREEVLTGIEALKKPRTEAKWCRPSPPSLLILSARIAAQHLTKGDARLLPQEVWPELQKCMDREAQVEVFAEFKWWFPGDEQMGDHRQYKDGKLHGEAKGWYQNGQMEVHGHYIHGKKEGEWKRWYCDGTLNEHLFYKKGKLHGECIAYYMDGRLCRHRHYIKGREEGESKRWRRKGQLMEQKHCVGGKAHGEYTKWGKNGRKRRHGFYKDGKKHGKWTQWFPGNPDDHSDGDDDDTAGQKQSEFHYDDEQMYHGKQTEWFRNGQVATRDCYVHGTQVGKSKDWNESGQLIKSDSYENGHLHGECMKWHPNGVRKEHGFYERGKRCGEWNWWYDTGLRMGHACFGPNAQT